MKKLLFYSTLCSVVCALPLHSMEFGAIEEKTFRINYIKNSRCTIKGSVKHCTDTLFFQFSKGHFNLVPSDEESAQIPFSISFTTPNRNITQEEFQSLLEKHPEYRESGLTKDHLTTFDQVTFAMQIDSQTHIAAQGAVKTLPKANQFLLSIAHDKTDPHTFSVLVAPIEETFRSTSHEWPEMRRVFARVPKLNQNERNWSYAIIPSERIVEQLASNNKAH